MEILNTVQVSGKGAAFVFLIFTIAAICYTFAFFNNDSGILCYGLSAKVESGRNRYECLIDDTVPFAEVAENYDVVGRRGDLWILEDKVDE